MGLTDTSSSKVAMSCSKANRMVPAIGSFLGLAKYRVECRILTERAQVREV